MTRASLSLALLLIGLSACAPRAGERAAGPAHAQVPVSVHGLRNVQRTLRLLESSTPTRHVPVRVLFYGQSITESAWSHRLAEALRKRYPDADLHVENRALGGFASQLLIKSAETDLYPYYPDLIIFQVYGAHDKYEEIIHRTRARTTAEILHQTDHITELTELTEETDPARLAPDSSMWNAFMNHAFLPSLVARYQTALCDQRAAWKQYLRVHGLPPRALLRDDVHLNGAGDVLMADLVGRCLRRAPELGPSPAERWVREHEVGRDVQWQDDTLTLAFEGNRVDVITAPDSDPAAVVRVLIDGKPPSAWPDVYAFSRAQSDACGKWPPLFDLSAEAPRVLESWRLHLTREADGTLYRFALTGSKTGFDGEGRTDQRFVSRSRRVVIDPEDWNIAYALELGGTRAPPDTLDITFRVEPHFTDAFAGAPGDPTRERAITVAQGLPNTRHVLELRRDGARPAPVARIRTYQPPLSSAAE